MNTSTIHTCTKERELGIMATQIANIKETTDRVEHKMDCFIERADETYATKTELHNAIQTLAEYDKLQDNKGNWVKINWFQILQSILFLITTLFLYLKFLIN